MQTKNVHDFLHFKIVPEMVELVNTYKPEIFWSDGDGEATADYWDSINFITW